MIFNWTEIIVLVLGIVVSICVSLITKQLVPWLKEKKLYDAAVIAVESAEALYGRYHGEQKLIAALESMKAKGYDIESSRVVEAVRTAWKDLDSAMRLTGEKQNEQDHAEENE